MLINCNTYKNGKKIDSPEHADIKHYLQESGCLVWMAVLDPTVEELDKLKDDFNLPALAVEDAQHGHQRPKIEEYKDIIFAVVHLPEVHSSKLYIGELCVFLKKNYVLSVRTNSNQGFNLVRQRLEKNPKLLLNGSGIIFYALVDAVVDRYFPLLYSFESDLDSIEQFIFNKRASHYTIKNLYALKSKVMQLKHAVDPLNESLKRLYMDGNKTNPMFSDCVNYFRDINDHLSKISLSLDSIVERINTAMQANISLLAIEESEVTKRLASWAAIFGVATAFVGIWGMNFKFMPELNWKYGYFVALGFIVVVCGYLYYRFKKSNWL